MKNLVNVTKAFIADEKGAETIEWVMVAAALAAVIIAVYGNTGTLRTALNGVITTITTRMAGV
jgi:Flp pilus assembly pilin Flp